MNKTFLNSSCALIIASSACAVLANDDAQSFIAPLVKESLLLDISVAKNTIIVGERGHILTADNNSGEFSQVSVPVKTTLTSVFSLDNEAWAVGHDATILKSDDMGGTWRLVQSMPELDRPFLDVHFFDKKEGIAVGAYGLFYRSIDGGESWTKETHPSVLSADDKDYLDSIKDDEAFYQEELSYISPHFNRLGGNNEETYLAGEAGLVAVSKDKGRSWERLDIDYLGSFFDLVKINDEIILAVGLRGNVFFKYDSQWRRLETCVTASLNSIVHEGSNALILGNNGTVLSLDIERILSDVAQQPNSEGCASHSALKLISTDFSDAILNGTFINGQLTAVTAGGLKTVKVTN